MTYTDIYRRTECQRDPKLPWSRVEKWGRIILFGLACAGAGSALTTAQFHVPWLQGRSAALTHVESHDIPKLKALIPRGTAGKTEAPSTTPACVEVHPSPKPD